MDATIRSYTRPRARYFWELTIPGEEDIWMRVTVSHITTTQSLKAYHKSHEFTTQAK